MNVAEKIIDQIETTVPSFDKTAESEFALFGYVASFFIIWGAGECSPFIKFTTKLLATIDQAEKAIKS